jgi:hypothetical protein
MPVEAQEQVCASRLSSNCVVGVARRPQDRVELIVRVAITIGQPRTTFEAIEVQPFHPLTSLGGELAVWSTERALRDAFAGRH